MRSLLVLLLLSSPCVSRAQETQHEGEPETEAQGVADDESEGAQAHSTPAVDPQALQRALAQLAREPSVERVVQATRSAAPRGRSRAIAQRARSAGWVPRVGLRARRGQAVDLSSAQAGDSLKLSTDDDLTLEASLTFELDRVVFRREEVGLEREARAERREVEQRVREVIALYFERRRLQLEQRLRGAKPERATRIAELEALLNVFTEGAFQRMIASSRWTTAAGTPATRPKWSPKSSSKTTP
jgi:hypothetical protein